MSASDANPPDEDDQWPNLEQEEAVWLLDVRSPEFAAEARRQSLLVANSPGEKEDMAFIESLTDKWLASLDAEEERAASERTGQAEETR